MRRPLTCVLAAAAITIAAPASAETITLKALGQPVATGLIRKNKEEPFFANFAERTGLDINIDYKPLDVTGIKDTEQLRILKNGLFDIVSLRMSQVSRDEPAILGLDLVGLNPDYDAGSKSVAAWSGEVDKLLQAKFNTKLLGIWPFGPQVLFCEPAISQLSDLAGKKVRVYDQNLANFVSSVGGTSVPIGFADVQQSLARGVVDCAITGPSSANSAGWPEVTTHMLPIAFQVAINGYGINLDTWNRLRDDRQHEIKAVCVVHNETSTGCTSDVAAVRRAIDSAGHPALLLVDTISSLGSMDYRHDAWGVDVTVAGSQKGLMLPPGLSFTAVSEKALAASKMSNLPKLFWAWQEMLAPNANGFFPYTPATNLLYGLAEAIDMLHEEGLDNVFARHNRHAEATRRAVSAWGLDILCREPRHYSSALTGVVMPHGHDADRFRAVVLSHFDMSLGAGLSKLAGRVFRIGHLGDTNDLTILGALAGVEMGLGLAGVPHRYGGVRAAMDHLGATAAEAKPIAA